MPPRPTRSQVASFLPLGEVEWEIVLALAEGPKHGYAVLLELEQRTAGPRVLPGSLYRALQRMARRGLLAVAVESAEGERRRVFELTPFGRRVAEAEASRLAESLRLARRRGLRPQRGES